MTSLQSRLDRIRDRVTSDEFLHGRGLGNDVPFYAFDYPSASEQHVNNHIEWLLDDLGRKTGLKVGVVNMFELAVEQLKRRDLYTKALAMEKAKGVATLLGALKGPLEPGKMAAALLEKFGGTPPDMLFLTGVGPAYPLIRTHSLLNNLQPLLGAVPLVLFFPGRFSGQSLQLFGDMQETPYYRAFRLVD
ncbi:MULTISPECIES: DUF1788 domain-containing protein [unclassified Novosphingobium]|uniref:DUF1788 domain-containing protein n=1 Tax=unclassified Novosphingobium TaxID=2644732 RepID=UPI001358A5F6|nr:MULTISPECIES: DUF1788 domain-containing protein [unclassified Novosphingobium]